MSAQISNESYFDMAVSNLEDAKDLYQSFLNGRERAANSSAFHLQQCVELMLKDILEVNGVDFPKTHVIDKLLYAIDDNDISVPFTNEQFSKLRLLSPRITNMETEMRYVKGMRMSGKILSETISFIEELVSEMKNTRHTAISCVTTEVGNKTNLKSLSLDSEKSI